MKYKNDKWNEKAQTINNHFLLCVFYHTQCETSLKMGFQIEQ
jgi:hypothetical protein